MAGWGGFLGKIADWFPGRKEAKLNRIEAIKNEMRTIQTKKGALSTRDASQLNSLSNELARLYQEIGTIS